MRYLNAVLRNSVPASFALVLLVACTSLSNKTSAPEPTLSTVEVTGPSAFIPSLLGKWTVGNVHDLAWRPDSKIFAVNYWVDGEDSNSFVQAFDVESLNSKWIADNSLATNLVFTPDGQFIVESNIFAPFFYWRSVEQGEVVREAVIEDLNQINPEDCQGGGQTVIANAYNNTILVADTNNLLGPGSNNIVLIRQWNLENGQCKELVQYQGSFDLFDLNSSGTHLAFGGEGSEHSIVIWDIEKQVELCRTSEAAFGRFVPGENTLAVLREEKIVFIDALTCQENRELSVSPSPDYENYLAFSPDGKQLAVARESIQIINAATGEMLAQFPFPERAVPISSNLVLNGIKFSPDGRYLLIAYDLLIPDTADDGEVQLWHLKP
jgi:WD40 repeat protein